MAVETCSSPLSADQLRRYRDDGYLVLRGVFPADQIGAALSEVDGLRKETGLVDALNLRCRFQKDVLNGECLFETFDPVVDISPRCHAIAHAPEILQALQQIYGEPPCLFKDKLIFKPPGATGYGLHQDYIAWKNFPRSFLTVLIAIDPCDPHNGSTELFPGYHHGGPLMPEDGQYHEIPLSRVDLTRGDKLTLAPGDIAIFGGFVPHRSAPNASMRWRRQLYLSYNARSDGGDLRESHYQDFHEWLRRRYAEYGKTGVYFQ